MIYLLVGMCVVSIGSNLMFFFVCVMFALQLKSIMKVLKPIVEETKGLVKKTDQMIEESKEPDPGDEWKYQP